MDKGNIKIMILNKRQEASTMTKNNYYKSMWYQQERDKNRINKESKRVSIV